MLFHFELVFFLVVAEKISLAFCIINNLQNISSNNNIKSESHLNFFNVLQLLKPSILEYHFSCEKSNVDFVYFSNSFPFFPNSIRDFQLGFLTISLILGTRNSPQNQSSSVKFNSKFHQSCPVILLDLKMQPKLLKIQDGDGDKEEESSNEMKLELALYNSFLPKPWTSPNFYVFSVVKKESESDSSSSEDMMNHLLKQFLRIRKIKEILPTSIFILPSSSEDSAQVSRLGETYELIKVLKLDLQVSSDHHAPFKVQKMRGLGPIFPPTNHKKVLNWNGAEMLVLTCPICPPSLDRYLESGMWDDPIAALGYEVANRVNATLELEGVFGQGNQKPDENGKWDGFMQPLIDGEAVISGVIKPTVLSRGLVLLSLSIASDTTGFIITQPNTKRMNSLWALEQPLEKNVWWSMIVTLSSAYFCLKLFIYCNTKSYSSSKRTSSFPVFPALLESTVEQSGFTSTMFSASKSVSDDLHDAVRIIVGTWLLGLIVLSAGYKSKFIERMTLPTFETIPTNFHELVNSDYEMGGVLWSSNLQHSFTSLKNNSIARVLLERVIDYNYFDPDCYRGILGKKCVCIGFKRVLGLLGLQFLIDVNKQKLFIFSTDSYFPAEATLGVPKDYPEIFEILNFFIRSFTDSGLLEKWLSVLTEFLTKIGQKNAKKYVETTSTSNTPAYGAYLGLEKQVSSQITMQREMSWLSIQLLIILSIISFLTLLIELGINYWRRWRQKDMIQEINASTSVNFKDETERLYQRKILF